MPSAKKRKGDNKKSKPVKKSNKCTNMQEWEVKHLTGNVDKYGRMEIKWKGFPESDKTFEPPCNIKDQDFCEKCLFLFVDRVCYRETLNFLFYYTSVL